MKTLVNIGAARRFTNRMQPPLAQFRFQQVDRFEMRAAFTEPFRQSRLRRAAINLNKRIKSHENSSSHAVRIELPLSQLAF